MNIDIKHIAKLSRLKIDESEIARYEKEMSDIIDMVEQLPAIEDDLLLDTSNVMKLRKDELSNDKISRDEILKNAPKVVAGCVVVPKTVD
ncbi:MAG: Asp-tRNA(Asn)/Glu-tRNA(Gln) amidotransferase subunit GatC [Oscillospiraceae bacterium]|nr:Asp-tRNA(Asn)/Glu-tRNA(Gln) amidotransferase subunit GatC [Oscillospiraceae bacterium]